MSDIVRRNGRWLSQHETRGRIYGPLTGPLFGIFLLGWLQPGQRGVLPQHFPSQGAFLTVFPEPSLFQGLGKHWHHRGDAAQAWRRGRCSSQKARHPFLRRLACFPDQDWEKKPSHHLLFLNALRSAPVSPLPISGSPGTSHSCPLVGAILKLPGLH